MFTLNYESVPVPYGKLGDPNITLTVPFYGFFPELITPPRIYAEKFGPYISGLFVTTQPTPTSHSSIILLAQTWQYYYPPFPMRWWRFDSITGAFVSRSGVSTNVSGDAFGGAWQMRDGSIFGSPANLGSVSELDPLTYEFVGSPVPNVIGVQRPLVDKAENIVVAISLGSSSKITVQSFSTGVAIREVTLSESIVAIVPEDNRRCFVITNKEIVHLVDYVAGRVLSTLRLPFLDPSIPYTSYPATYLFTFDRHLRRFLIFTRRPEAVDGACVSTIRGFYPVPKAVGITKAIPLKPIRTGVTVPCLAKVYGDAGEGFQGIKIAASITGSDAVLTGRPPVTDQDGDALIHVLGAAEGSITLTLAASV